MNLEHSINKWLENWKDIGYKHFDAIVHKKDYYSGGKYREDLAIPKTLKSHKYWPFLRQDKRTRTFRKNNERQLEISEKCRPIMYASHRDSKIMSFYAFLLKRNYEESIKNTALDSSIIGYRHIESSSGRGKSNVDFALDIWELIKELDNYTIICLDIKGYFDNMDHAILREKVVTFSRNIPIDGLKTIIDNVTKYRYVFRNDAERLLGKNAWANSKRYNELIAKAGVIHKNRKRKGIPQGSPISDIFSNIYLYDFDKKVIEIIGKFENSFYRRYCDDIIIAVPNNKAHEIYDAICRLIKEYKVEIKTSKTEAFSINASLKQFSDITHELVPNYSKHKEFLQYLGFDMNLNTFKIRTGTVIASYRRADRIAPRKNNRPPKEKRMKRYGYLKQVEEKAPFETTRKQAKKVRKGIKKRFIRASARKIRQTKARKS